MWKTGLSLLLTLLFCILFHFCASDSVKCIAFEFLIRKHQIKMLPFQFLIHVIAEADTTVWFLYSHNKGVYCFSSLVSEKKLFYKWDIILLCLCFSGFVHVARKTWTQICFKKKLFEYVVPESNFKVFYDTSNLSNFSSVLITLRQDYIVVFPEAIVVNI